MGKNFCLYQALARRVNNEYNSFKDEEMKKTSIEVFNDSYKIYAVQQMSQFFFKITLLSEQIRLLLREENLLTQLYQFESEYDECCFDTCEKFHRMLKHFMNAHIEQNHLDNRNNQEEKDRPLQRVGKEPKERDDASIETCCERLKREHPERFVLEEPIGCPDAYGYAERPSDFCRKITCTECWDRTVEVERKEGM